MRRRTEGLRGEGGMTLPELLVAMFIGGIALSIIAATFTSMATTLTRDRAVTESTAVATAGMNELTRVIRSGTEIRVNAAANKPVFEVAKASELVLHAFLDTDALNPQPIKVRFWVNARGELVESRWAASALPGGFWQFPPAASPISERVIARQIVRNGAGAHVIFRYHDSDSDTLEPAASVFSTSELRSIAAVEVTLTVQADETERGAPVTQRNTVGIPNLGISRVGL